MAAEPGVKNAAAGIAAEKYHGLDRAALVRLYRTMYLSRKMDDREMQYLYSDESGYHFMDRHSYEQIALTAAEVGDDARFLLENAELTILLFNGRPVSLSLPNFVVLEVVETDPGVKGDTATGGRKPATMSTGAVIQVPLFIGVGDVLKVDTRTGEYLERASSA